MVEYLTIKARLRLLKPTRVDLVTSEDKPVMAVE